MEQNPNPMKKLKIKPLWVVTIDFEGKSIQWGAFKYKKEAKAFAVLVNGKIDGKKKLVTDKY